MIQKGKGQVTISNDGATILKLISVTHPCAKMLVELSAAQDAEAGDGTTSVVVIAGSLLAAAERLLERGIHPSRISEAFQKASKKACEFVRAVSLPVFLDDSKALQKAASTSLSSKVLAPHAESMSEIAVNALKSVIRKDGTVDLKDVRMIKKVGGNIEETSLQTNAILLHQRPATAASGPTRIENAKIALVQFQLSPPKPDIDSQIVVSDWRQMDRILKEERQYLLEMCKKIKKSNANVLLVQKSILRDGVSELALHFLAKLKIMVVSEVERDEIEYLSRALGCAPIADIEGMREDRLGLAETVEEFALDGGGSCAPLTKISGIKGNCATAATSILVRGSNELVVEEVERSLHDALCVIRCLVREGAMIPGGGAPEMQASLRLSEWAKGLEQGVEAVCVEEYARALEIIPATLAENAGLDGVEVVSLLRKRHALAGDSGAGVNVRKGGVSGMLEEGVVQPLLVTLSAIGLATEAVCLVLKIDDIVQSR